MDLLAKYIGIPYVPRGRTTAGLDCWGLVRLIYRDLGFEIPDIEDYEMEAALKGKAYEAWIRNSLYKPFDVALYLNTEGVAFHSGIVTPDHRLIHASKQGGVVIQNLGAMNKAINLDAYYHLKARDDNDKI